MKIITYLMNALTVPVIIMNFVGGIVGIIWLTIIGEWRIALACFGIGMFGNWLLMWPLLLGGLFAFPAEAAMKKGKLQLASVLLALSSGYTVAIMTAWASGCLLVMLSKAGSHSILPFLLCSYGAATAPWASMAQKEMDGSGFSPSALLAGILCMSYVVAIVLAVFGVPLIFSLVSIDGFMLAGWILTLVATHESMRAEVRPWDY